MGSADKAPIVELVVAVKFLPMPGLDATKLQQLHAAWAADFPVLSYKNADTILDPSGANLRSWSESLDRRMLVQAQVDRLIVNWRRVSEDDVYPGFESCLDVFQRVFAVHAEVLSSLDLPAAVPVEAEVTYIDRLPADSVANPEKFISLFDARVARELPGVRKATRFAIETEIPSDGAKGFPAKVHLGADHASFDGQSAWFLNCTALLSVGSSGDVVDALVQGHQIGSNVFEAIITPQYSADLRDNK